jgi:basic membrane protein A
MRKILFLILAVCLLLTCCAKEGDTVYQWDPDEPKASMAPLVTVIYGIDALGDRSYCDLIYRGVEAAAAKHGLRTMQLSPTSYEEGIGYLQSMFQTVKSQSDTTRRLFVVVASSYDDYIRQNSHLFEGNPYADLLYLETPEPLASGGSTLYLPYYGAMYEAGALRPAFSVIGTTVTLVVSNPVDPTVTGAAKGFADGFFTDYYSVENSWGEKMEKQLNTICLAEKAGEGYNIADSTALRILNEVSGTMVPICGGSGYTLMYLADITLGAYYMGIDVEKVSNNCFMSILKHVDRAVGLCISQWLSPEGMPRHQVLGLKDGYTSVSISPIIDNSYKASFNKNMTEELRRQIHEDAIRKEEAYEQK